ncbi:MAG: cysteine protease LapG [Pseudomonas sp.]|uniref:cysteine protease LapG n=1 Tax=Pseudomonas sp. TaxID=306 RepID=UPI003397DFBA
MRPCSTNTRSSSRPWRSVAAVLAWVLVGGLHAEWNIADISRRAEALYGPLGAGRERIEAWQAVLDKQAGRSVQEQLRAVNSFFNQQLQFRDDLSLWQAADYWATPVESLRRGAGDCEDFAIAKYFSLRRLGVPSDKLRITYVKALRLNQPHMVLTYYASPEAIPLVLDNLFADIRPANQRTDLLPVYAFNGEGLWSGSKRVGDSKRLSRWQDLMSKMRAEGFPADWAQ